MKILKPRTIQEFQCDYCKKRTRTMEAMIRHETICYYNTERECETCQNEGIEMLDGVGFNLGIIPDADSRACPSCLIAKDCGGKSYFHELPENERKEYENN